MLTRTLHSVVALVLVGALCAACEGERSAPAVDSGPPPGMDSGAGDAAAPGDAGAAVDAGAASIDAGAFPVDGTVAGLDSGSPGDAGPPPDAGPPYDSGAIAPGPCPPLAPDPAGQMGACCWRASNATRLDAPELRVAGLRVASPASLASTIIRGLFSGALDEERMNWIFQLTGAPVAGSGTVAVRTGGGRRAAGGTFSFYAGDAPAPGAAGRWNPVARTGALDGELFSMPRVDDLVVLPLLDDLGATTLELPLRSLEIRRALLSEDRSCVGIRRPASYDTSAGDVTAFLTITETSGVTLSLGSIDTSLCMLVAGMSSMPGACATHPRAEWFVKPDAICDAAGCRSNTEAAGTCDPDTTCNAWQLEAAIAAQGVEITP